MNNKGSLLVNSILGVAIIILFVLHFSGDTKSNVTDTLVVEEKVEPASVVKKHPADSNRVGLTIGYVNSDTVTANYLFSKQLNADLMAKQSSAENKLRKEAEKLQADAQKFQQGAPIMGREELERTQAELMQRQEELQMMEYELSQKLQDKGYKANYDYIMATDKYLQKIGKELGYDYIFGYRTGDLVMYANPDFDITKQVIELLNNEYRADKMAD
jgi:outer membrane protein